MRKRTHRKANGSSKEALLNSKLIEMAAMLTAQVMLSQHWLFGLDPGGFSQMTIDAPPLT